MKKAAVIHDLSGFGKCSLTAAIPVLSALGVQCCPVATAVLTGQTGYPCYHCTDLTAMLPDYIDAWGKNNAHFDAIYSGFLTGAKQISQVLDFIHHFREEHTLLLVDPVMGDDGNAYPFFTPGLLNGMKELTLEADVITPNLTEACLLADIPENALLHCRTNTDLLKLAEEPLPASYVIKERKTICVKQIPSASTSTFRSVYRSAVTVIFCRLRINHE